MDNLIFCGYPSSGKTYFGQRLAEELGKLFIDTDLLIERLYQKEYGESLNCRNICLSQGEKQFRLLEERVIDSLQLRDTVIAVGGGAVLNPKNCLKLQQLGKLIYLEADKEVVKNRIFSNGIPAFLDPNDPDRAFEKMAEERKSIYLKISSFTVKIQGKTEQQILDELKAIVASSLSLSLTAI